jgi:DNA-directed RNA polymerase subunit M/transcription elongation factor TFIIS
MKRCTKCGEMLPTSAFSKKRGGLEARCRACRVVAQQAYAAANPDKIKANNAAHYAANRESRKAYQRQHAKTDAGRAVQSRADARRRLKWPEKEGGRVAVSRAVAAGRLPRAADHPCGVCGDDAESYHHLMGYVHEHWLSVIPLCAECHRAEDLQPVTDREAA